LKIFIKAVFTCLALSAIGGVFLLGIIIYISFDLPQINSLSDYSPPIPSKVYSKDGHLLMELSLEKRELTSIDEIPQRVIDTFLAAEDDNFYNHSGIDYTGIARAMLINIKAGRVVQGASTITQQVAKSLLLSNERTFTRKIKDLILAKKIEEKLTKKEILFLYLNQVYLGGGYYGIKSAFRGYFDKEISEATIAEVALVAGLLVAPGKYSPYVNPEMAKSRQKYVITRLYKTEKITEEEYNNALNETIKIQIRKPIPFKAGYFTDWIRQRLIAHFGKEDFLVNGYEVVTTLDWSLQEKAEEEISKGVAEIDKRQGYKGVLRTIDTQEKINEFLISQRDSLYEDSSNYLMFNVDGTTTREFQPEENEVKSLLESETEILSTVNVRGKVFLELGNLREDEKFLKFVDFNRPVEAVVTKVSNLQRMIYANYAGLKIMIPYENFKWAHERKIQEERYYWGFLIHPETTFKPGDVILVKIDKKTANPMQYAWSDFKKSYGANKELIAEISKQSFYLAHLEQDPEAQGALLSISPQTGEIVSMVGGSDFSKSQFNRAVQSNRQPGSAFKPLIYAVGLENQYTPASILLDSPAALGGVDETSLSWKPRNYDGEFKGTMTFRKALETSRNIPTIKLAQDVGVDKIINFVDRMHMDIKLPNDLSVSLGSFGVNLLDLVRMYSIFPNGGRKIKLKSIISIKDRYGKVHHIDSEDEKESEAEVLANSESQEDEVPVVIPNEVAVIDESGELKKETSETVEEQNPFLVNLDENQIYDERLAFLMSNLLKGVVQRGTGKSTSDISSFIGGKTGTTNNYIDAWFIGFSPKIVTGVWTGFDNNQTMGFGETGAKSALPIWKEYMRNAIRKFGDVDFQIPSGIINIAIDEETGRQYQDGPNRFVESFVEGTGPGNDTEKLDPEVPGSGISILDGDDYYGAQ